MAELKQLTGKKKRQKASAPRLLREIAYERLKVAIRDGEFQSGEPLSETRLSEALQISRTPVREALQQLAQEGLVQILPNRAVTVAAPSMQDVLNVLHVRSLVEPEIARLVAGSISPQAVDLLWKAVSDMGDAAQRGDRPAWSRADNVYHETISAACPNALLGQLGLQMRNRMQFSATDAQTTPARLIACTEEHRAVVAAIAKRDAQAAQQAMQEHIEQLRTSFFKRLLHA